jgi:predicted amidohydrolase YtcJ
VGLDPADVEIVDSSARGALLVADRIITLGHGRHGGRALLVRGKRVVWVGNEPSQAPPHGTRIDLDGCTIGPGFVDAHVHLTATGLTLNGIDLRDTFRVDDLLRLVRTTAAATPGRVVWGHGWDADLDRLPTPDELTAAADGRTVVLSRIDGHSSVVDRRTLTSAPLARAPGLERDATGEPTGVLKLEANKIARRWAVGALSESELSDARERVARHAASLGIVSAHEMNGPDLFGAADFDAWHQGAWPLEIVPYWSGIDLSFAAERELTHIGGDLYLDGSLGAHTAALDAEYADRGHRGHLEFDDATLRDLFTEATMRGLQVAVHAIGDGAVRQAVRCWQQVEDRLPAHLDGAVHRLHHRIEHAEVLPPDLYDAVAMLGLVLSVQPAFETMWGNDEGLYDRRLGVERAAWTNPYRALADRGIDLAFGSDSNVTPMDPWGTVYAAQHRRHPEHAMTRLEAISAHTLGGRTAARQERAVGTLRAGMRADLAVWEGDPFRADDPRGAKCALTVLRGRVTHGIPHAAETMPHLATIHEGRA